MGSDTPGHRRRRSPTTPLVYDPEQAVDSGRDGAMAEPIRVVVVDDQAEMLRHITRTLARVPIIEVVGEGGDGFDAAALVANLDPDVVLIDLVMPKMGGIEAIRRIVASGARARLIALTTMSDDDTFSEALQAGAAGFLLKGSTVGEIVHAIQVVHAGEAMLSPELVTRLVARFARPERAGNTALSDPEASLLRLVAEGLSNEEIAQRRHLSPATVKSYLSRLLAKTGCRDRAQLVILAYRTGIATP